MEGIVGERVLYWGGGGVSQGGKCRGLRLEGRSSGRFFRLFVLSDVHGRGVEILRLVVRLVRQRR